MKIRNPFCSSTLMPPRSFLIALLLAFCVLCGGQAKADLVTWTGVPDGYINDSYDILFIYGSAPYTWTLAPGSDPIPDGLSFNDFQYQGLSALELKGVPTKEGTYNVLMLVTYGNGQQDSWKFTIIIKPEYPLSIRPERPFLPRGFVGESYSQTFSASAGSPPYRWSVAAAPPNLTINSTTGVLSGITTKQGAYTFQVSCTDNAGFTKTRRYTLVVSDTPFITNADPLPNGLLNTAYEVQLTGKGGTAPYSYEVTGLDLPPGLTMSSLGLITGTPSTEGTYRVEITISDSSSPVKSSAEQFTINVYGLDISPKTLPNGVQGSAYPLPANSGQTTLTVAGGQLPIRFRVTKGKLPAGMGWSADGNTVTFRGFPRAGSAAITLTYVDASGQKGEQELTFTITSAGSPTISTSATLANGKVGEAYSVRLEADGENAPYAWRILTLSSLPKGIFVDSTGLVSGTPTVAGTYKFTVQVMANNRQTTSQTFTLTVDP